MTPGKGGVTFIWDNAGGYWEEMVAGVNTGTEICPEAWGPEVAFAESFHLANPGEPLFIVKSAKGSTGLAESPDALDWSPNSQGEMFDLTAERVAQARASLGGAEVDGVFLFQGEQDASDAASAAAYGENLVAWLAAIRAEWMGDPDGKIAFGRINDSTTHFEQVRWAQYLADLADPNAVSFDTYAYDMQSDRMHYAAGGYVAIGRDFHSAYDNWA